MKRPPKKRLLTAKDIQRRLPEYVALHLIRTAFTVARMAGTK